MMLADICFVSDDMDDGEFSKLAYEHDFLTLKMVPREGILLFHRDFHLIKLGRNDVAGTVRFSRDKEKFNSNYRAFEGTVEEFFNYLNTRYVEVSVGTV